MRRISSVRHYPIYETSKKLRLNRRWTFRLSETGTVRSYTSCSFYRLKRSVHPKSIKAFERSTEICMEIEKKLHRPTVARARIAYKVGARA